MKARIRKKIRKRLKQAWIEHIPVTRRLYLKHPDELESVLFTMFKHIIYECGYDIGRYERSKVRFIFVPQEWLSSPEER